MTQSIFSFPTVDIQKARLFRSWRELTYLALMAMEMCWIALWYTNLSYTSRGVSYGKAFLVFGALLLASNLLARYFNQFEVKIYLRRAIFIFLIIVSLWIGLQVLLYYPAWLSPAATVRKILTSFADLNTIPSEFWVMLVILLIWSRGIGLAHRALGIDLVLRNFQLGLLMFFFYGAFIQLIPLDIPLSALALFFLFGLVAMSMGRIVESSHARGARITRVSYSWLAGIILIVALILLITLLPARLIPLEASAYIGRYLTLALAFIGGLMLLVISPVILLFLYVLPFIKNLFHIVFSWPSFSLTELLKPLNLTRNLDNLVEKVTIAKPAVLWGILILVGLAVLLGLSFRIWIDRRTELEEGESLLDPADLLKNLRQELRKRFDSALDRVRRRRSSANRLLIAAQVRWMYARLMHECETLKHPRPPAVTPLEFLNDLRELFPDAQAETGALTQAYVRVRYGQIPESAEELSNLIAGWNNIQRTVRKKH